MADGTLNFDTKIDDSGFQSGANSIGDIVKGIGVEKLIEGAVTKTIELGKACVDVGMNFESSMSQVAATMGITTEEIAAGSEEFTALENAAKQMGATTQFSASQSAEALNYLALAGYSVEESIETLPTVLNLAAAGGMELGEASDMVTDAMAALGLETKDSATFVDKMAKTAQKSNTSVKQLGSAILTVGGTAKMLKGGTTELNAALGVLANRGIKGAEGGTALRNILLALNPTTDKAQAAFKRLGVSAYDSDGNMRDLNSVFMDLNDAMDGMTDEEKQNVLSDIFNKADLKSAQALLAGCGEEFENLAAAIDDSDGAASNMAATMNDNLQGSLTLLNSALEGLGIEIYQSFAPALNDLVKFGADSVSKLVTGMQENGIAGAIQAAAGIASGLFNTFAERAPGFISSGLEIVTNFANGILDGLPDTIANASSILAEIATTIISAIPDIQAKGCDIITGLANGILENLPAAIAGIGTIVSAIISAVMEAIPKMLSNGVTLITSLAGGIVANLPAILSSMKACVNLIINTVKEKAPAMLDKGVELITELATGLTNTLPAILSAAVELMEFLISKIAEYLPQMLAKGISLVAKLAAGIGQNIPALVSTIAQALADLLAKIAENLPTFLQQGVELLGQVASGIIQAIPDLVAKIPEVIAEIVNAFTSYDWGSLGLAIIDGIKNGIVNAAGSLAEAAKTAASNAFNGVKGLLGISSPSKKFKWIGRMCDEGLAVGFKENALAMRESMQGTINDVMGKLNTDLAFTTSYNSGGASVGGSAQIGNNRANNNLSRLIELQEENNKNQKRIASRPIYLGTERIDQELPKGAVPVV